MNHEAQPDPATPGAATPSSPAPAICAPASFSQQRLWLLDRMLPVRSIYNNRYCLRLAGSLDVDALRRAINEIVRRHEVLRTCFVIVDGAPMQKIMPTLELPIEVASLESLPPDARAAEARRVAGDEAQTPFDLQHDPPLRARLLRLGADEHWLLLTLHHIASDAWSSAIWARELAALYDACSRGAPSPLAELPVQYADFAEWQREWLQGDVLAQQLGYWQRTLADLPIVELPTDRPRPPIPTYRGAHFDFAIDDALAAGLIALARKEGATLYMTLLAAFHVLLYRYTGQEDVVVGSPIAGRRRTELEGLIGFFVNTLVMRGDLSGDPPFVEYLRRVRARALDAYAHQDIPFEKLVEELTQHRDPSRNPLFQVAFSMRNAPRAPWQLLGLEVQRLTGIGVEYAKFDLTLSVTEIGGRISASIEYLADLFDPGTIARLASHWQRLLQGIVADPTQPVSRIPLVDAAAREWILREWNDTRTVFPADAGVPALFAAQAQRSPHAVAVVDGARTRSYEEIDTRSGELAHALRDRGVAPGSRVGVCSERSAEEVIAFLGVLKAGCAYVPLDPSHPPARLAAMLADAEAAAVVTTPSAALALAQARTSSARPVLMIDADQPPAAPVRGDPRLDVGGEDLAYVMYTSGSTGAPKGVAVPHRAIARLVCGTNYVSLGPKDVIAHLSNPAFDASTFEIWGALLNGARLAIVPRETVLSPTDLAAALERHGVTVLFLTTALFNQIAGAAPHAFAGRQVLFGGEAVDPAAVTAVLREGKPRRLLHVYGPTETTTFATWHEVRDVDPGAATVPIGTPIANTDVYLLDVHGEPVPPGVPGEIHIGGPGLARGYLGRADLTAERFVPHPFDRTPGARLYRTGDRARYRDDGAIEFIGRRDQQVKIRGHRIEPAEVEAALMRLPLVREAVVVVHGATAETRRLAAYVVPAGETPPEAADLWRDLRRSLPDYMVPAAVVYLAALPLTANGKLDRAALPDPDAIAARRTGWHIPPRDPLEYILVNIWEDLLGIRGVGLRDNFFDLGGHSLLAARMMDAVERACGRTVPLMTLFTESTIEHLADAIRRGGTPSPTPVVAVQEGGTRPPLFFLHGDFTGGGFYCHGLARELGADQPFYAVHPHGLDGSAVPDSIEAMAAELLREVRRVCPEGPFVLGGHCNGALIAVEMARQLAQAGERVPFVVVVEAKAPRRVTRVFEGVSMGTPSARSRRSALQPVDEPTTATGDVFVRYRNAILKYAPAPYPGRIAVLHSKAIQDPRPGLGWSLLAAHVETHPIQGDHQSAITRYVAETGARIRACLEAAGATEQR